MTRTNNFFHPKSTAGIRPESLSMPSINYFISICLPGDGEVFSVALFFWQWLEVGGKKG